jgi:hypothetical protein
MQLARRQCALLVASQTDRLRRVRLCVALMWMLLFALAITASRPTQCSPSAAQLDPPVIIAKKHSTSVLLLVLYGRLTGTNVSYLVVLQSTFYSPFSGRGWCSPHHTLRSPSR